VKFITVFTPAFNRAYCLHRVYESLLAQTNPNFTWLIVDDGSSDNTKELVQLWIAESKLDINYIFKKNGGMHTAHNTAYKNITTELNVCIDSDDFMPETAIQKIYGNWQSVKSDQTIAGLMGLDESLEGKLIGSQFPHEFLPSSLSDFYYKQGGTGDKKIVLRTILTTAYPSYPEWEEERLVPLDTLYVLICRDYKLVPVNQVFCIVDYQQDGSSATIINQYFKSAKGFRYSREVSMKYGGFVKLKVRSAIHYNISTFIIGDITKLFNSPDPLLTLSLTPFSYFFYLYLKFKRSM
jgi:glycosyltransferase involved in cell wall biosynthesis